MRIRGFTLVELAVVMAIVGLLLGGLMFTLSAQTEQRNFEETRRRLDQARELLLAFAVSNGRLPCPARTASTTTPATAPGAEVRDSATGDCTGDSVSDYYGGLIATGVTGGLLPARTIGYQQVSAAGFAVDAWQNPIRYAVARTNTNCAVSPPANTRLFTHKNNLRTYGLSCQPNDLLVCKSSTGISSTTCGTAFGTSGENQITTSDLIVAIVFSTGKNGATVLGSGADERANLNITSGGAASIDPVFVSHAPTPSEATNGEFDDQFTWITVGEFYGKLISGGVLP